MPATIIDGNVIADKIKAEVKEEIKKFGITPKLGVILIGEDPASKIYIERKQKACSKLGINSHVYEFPVDTPAKDIIYFIKNAPFDGILVQLPLPHSKNEILNAIPPNKDVDCFNAYNVGLLSQGEAILKPCTPSAVIEILNYHNIPTSGKRIVIVNNTEVVGKPLAMMLSQAPYNATVTICHSYTTNIFQHTLRADILITAVGKYPNFWLTGDYLRPESTVIDVAMNKVDGKLFGDVDFEEAKNRASFLTKVPSGVGPITTSILMRNTLIAAKLQKGLL